MKTVVDVANVLSAVGTLIALPFAVFAYLAAQRANRIALEARQDAERLAKEQGRKTFELELLRELNDILVGLYGGTSVQLPKLVAISAKLLMLPMSELPEWAKLANESLEQVKETDEARFDDLPARRATMHSELLAAIKRRME